MLLNIKKSIYSATVLCGAHLGAIGIALSLPFGIGLRTALSAAVAASFGWQWSQFRRWRGGDWRVDDDGGCFWYPHGDDRPVRYELLRAETGALWIRLLIERRPERPRHLFIWKDAVDPEVFHDLHARIEQRRLPAPDRDRI